jgi:xylan 1,4-beta-xylosidase
MVARFRNPVLPGSHPDPSVCRVGADYYLATSTFEYFPGIALHHSRDLVHWRPIGSALDRPEQLPLDGVRPSGGLYAPTIRHADGVFHLTCTLVDPVAPARGGNFVVTATDPAGPWSAPVWLDDAPGFDPSLVFDGDGRAWWCGAWERDPAGRPGRTTVWLQELDRGRMALVGPRHFLWEGAMRDARWAEGPHLYRVDGAWYLLAAEGGTGHDHAVAVARSRHVTGPYEPCPRNPVLTCRHLGRGAPVVGAGHADLVQTQVGEWWALLLAARPTADGTWNTGRETFLVPVAWEDGWPVFAPGKGRVPLEARAPALAPHPWPAPPRVDGFDAPELGPEWLLLRTPRERWWSLTDRPGHLRLRLRPASLADRANPSFVGRRVAHASFTAAMALDFSPAGPGERAGLVLLHSDAAQLRLDVHGVGRRRTIQLVRRAGGAEEVAAEQEVPPGPLLLGVEARGQAHEFRVGDRPGSWRTVGTLDGGVLSATAAGGFFGVLVGVHATSGGAPSATVADVDWFEYGGIDGTGPAW